MVASCTLLTLDAVAERLIGSLENSVTRAMYGKSIRDFLSWYAEQPPCLLSRSLLETYRTHLTVSKYSASSINQRLSAIRRLVLQAGDEGLLPAEQALIATRIPGVPKQGVRPENWLSPDEAEALVNAPDPSSPKGLRDSAILALLVGCGLRRGEVVSLKTRHLERREGRWVLLDIEGKHGRIRTVPVPPWVKTAIDAWLQSAQITEGRLFRAVERGGAVRSRPICAQTVFDIVVQQGKAIGVSIRPHDLRRYAESRTMPNRMKDARLALSWCPTRSTDSA
jgi:integrase